MIGRNIGIDLGTTQSSTAFYHLKTVNLQNTEGEFLTPSCVSKIADSFIVGQTALNWMKQSPQSTVRSIKRLIGRSFDDPSVQKMISENRVTYRIQPYSQGEKCVAVVLDGQEFLPEDLSAEILKKLIKDAEQSLQSPVNAAVVTVPAFFNDKQKNATRVAASKAGIQLLRLLPEPTAAALSFGLELASLPEGQQVLIFDFGGGTLDLSLLAVSANQYLELGKGGDSWLGGDDIDQLLIDAFYEIFENENGFASGSMQKWVSVLSESEKSRWTFEMKTQAEAAKIALSSRENITVDILGLLKDDQGDLVNFEAEISRKDFEKILKPVVDRSIELVKKLISELHFNVQDISHVLMVGGSSQIPLVQESVRNFFSGQQVICHERPLLAIAEGAAILAHQLSLDEDGKFSQDFGLIHTTSHDYLLELENGETSSLIEKNTPLPCQVRRTYQLTDKKQNLLHLKFINPVNDEYQTVGNLWISLFDEREDQGGSEGDIELRTVIVDFSIDTNNIIQVSVQLENFPDKSVTKTLSRGYIDEKLFLELGSCIEAGNQEGVPYFTAMDVELRSRFLVTQINQLIDPVKQNIDSELLGITKRGLAVTREILKTKGGSFGQIFYSENLLTSYGGSISPQEKKDFEENI